MPATARPSRPRRTSRSRIPAAVVAVVAAAGLLAACTGGVTDPAPDPGPTTVVLRPSVALPDAATTVVPDQTASATALAVSGALFATAPVVVLVDVAEPDRVAPAASAAVALGAPVLVAGAGVPEELERLGTTDVLVVGDGTSAAGLPDDVRTYPVDAADPAALEELVPSLGARTPTDALVPAVAALARPEPALLVVEPGPGAPAAPAAEDAVVEDAAVEDSGATAGSPTAAPRSTGRGADASAAPSLRVWAGVTREATTGDAATGDATTGDATTDDATTASGHARDDATTTSDGAHRGAGSDEDAPVLGSEATTVEPPEPPSAAALLVDSHAAPAGTALAAATARAAGVPVVDVPGGDPRATSAAVRALTGVTTVVAVGSSFGDAARLGPRVASASTGVELPGGGQLVFPDPATAPGVTGKRYVALYGTPGTPALGVLGEQDTPATIARAQQTAAPYDALTEDTVVPTLEIIATIASAAPEADGSYSRPRTVDELRPLVEAAGEAGLAVVIDLQPGRTDFVTQARQYEDLLAYPHVGLALDPEWRLAPDQVHLRQIGSVGVDEVDATAEWLAAFTRERALPQKLFVLHQFSTRMITDRERLRTDHDELAVLIHADGQGSQPAKAGTWATLRQGAPDVHWGWKNFYDEDEPMLDPAQTFAVQPTPDLVTYQ